MSKRDSIFCFEPIVVGEGVLPHGRELMAINRQDILSIRRYVFPGEELVAVVIRDGRMVVNEKMRLGI